MGLILERLEAQGRRRYGGGNTLLKVRGKRNRMKGGERGTGSVMGVGRQERSPKGQKNE